MAFKVGDKVVCVADQWKDVFNPNGNCLGPDKNEIYVIIDIITREGLPWLRFVEFSKDAFDPNDFRKLHDETVERIIKQVTQKPVVLS